MVFRDFIGGRLRAAGVLPDDGEARALRSQDLGGRATHPAAPTENNVTPIPYSEVQMLSPYRMLGFTLSVLVPRTAPTAFSSL